jgi:hypothetical protein
MVGSSKIASSSQNTEGIDGDSKSKKPKTKKRHYKEDEMKTNFQSSRHNQLELQNGNAERKKKVKLKKNKFDENMKS